MTIPWKIYWEVAGRRAFYPCAVCCRLGKNPEAHQFCTWLCLWVCASECVCICCRWRWWSWREKWFSVFDSLIHSSTSSLCVEADWLASHPDRIGSGECRAPEREGCVHEETLNTQVLRGAAASLLDEAAREGWRICHILPFLSSLVLCWARARRAWLAINSWSSVSQKLFIIFLLSRLVRAK